MVVNVSFKVSDSGMLSVIENTAVRIVDPISTADLFHQFCKPGFQLQLPSGNWLMYVEDDCDRKEVYAVKVSRGFRDTLIRSWANALEVAIATAESREAYAIDADTYVKEARFYNLSTVVVDHLELRQAEAENRRRVADMVVLNTTMCLESAFKARTEVEPNGSVYVLRDDVSYGFMQARGETIARTIFTDESYQWAGLLPRPQFITDVDADTL